jgi:3-dehydroquinate synthase
MKTIPVRLKERSYRIRIGVGLLDESGAMARASVGEKALRAVIISNPTVGNLYGARTERSFRRAGFDVHSISIGDGERHKTLRTASSLYTYLIKLQAERSDIIVALGGGVIGDIAGFVAATYLRGVRFIQVPTTLLAQIDSSVGGKTGVNHPLGKNLVGAFHQPSLVVIDAETLESLPPRQLRAGLFEAIKYGVISDRRLFDRIAREIERLKSGEPSEIEHLVSRCCRIKASVVERDEREGGLRRILNFGHTVGHALEAVTGYRRFLHGEAVGHGMRAASLIAERMQLLSGEDRKAIEETIRRVGPLPQTRNLALDGIISAMSHDKKAERGRVSLVLPVEIGRVVIRSDAPSRIIRSALKETLL